MKTNGSLHRPPHLELDVAFCDIKFWSSPGARRNMKSFRIQHLNHRACLCCTLTRSASEEPRCAFGLVLQNCAR